MVALWLPLLWLHAGLPKKCQAPARSLAQQWVAVSDMTAFSSLGVTAMQQVQQQADLTAKGLSIQMKNANQCWDVPEAVEWMSKLAEFKPLWTEEPTSPDDILRHTTISKVEKLLLLRLPLPYTFCFVFQSGCSRP